MFSVAITLVISCTLAFLALLVSNHTPSPARQKQVRPLQWVLGFELEVLAYVVVVGTRISGTPTSPSLMVSVVAVLLALVAPVLAYSAMKQMGKQFTMQAGLVAEHHLVTTGAYAVVRHPFYAAILCLFLGTALLLVSWPVLLVTSAIFLIGTELRVRSEDALLQQHFGASFVAYQKRVSAYIPLIR